MKKIRKIILFLLDIIIIYTCLFLSLCIKFDGRIPAVYLKIALTHGVFICLIMICMFYAFALYKSLWEYASVKELIMILLACFSGMVLSMMLELLFCESLPFSVLIIASILITALVGGMRICIRLLRRIRKRKICNHKCDFKRVMVVGAGDDAARIIREITNNPCLKCKVVIAVDDNKKTQGGKILGIPIVGDTQSIQRVAAKYGIDEIVFAMPNLHTKEKKRIIQNCLLTGCNMQVMSSISRLFLNGRLSDCTLRPATIKDLLGREEVELNIPSIAGYLKDKVVLITGGGGSIGSEIARQAIIFNIKRLVILDIYENNAYDLKNELVIKYGTDLKIDIIIASIRDEKRLKKIFLEVMPDVVFHAAAYKHVQLMEESPYEAVNNNIIGTLNLVKLADKSKVEKFILISTDKAVNPTSVMGATKRVAEMIIQSYNKHSDTQYMAVRFGNVLASSGSVIPIFQKQIRAGGPVTVTHPDVERFFMTITEAAQLVIQAGALAEGGEIFVLDMGEPVKIIELARKMIVLFGLTPEVDIDIQIIGLSPGEKLFEELIQEGTVNIKTQHDKIFVEFPGEISFKELIDYIEMLKNSDDSDIIRTVIYNIIPTYKFNKD